MTPAQKEVKDAFILVSTLTVAGDAVDIVAAVREHMRKAYDLAADHGE